MDFEHTKKTKDLMSIVADFINTHIKPAESIYAEEMETYRREGDQWRVPKILYELKEKAKGAGLWNFSLTGDLGYGLTNLEFAPLAEMMGVGWTSEVFNSSAPDAGNMEVLDKYGTKEQKDKWLPPLILGKEKTCFGVTEPDAGLDTGRLKTFAKKINNGYLVNGQKIWTSTAKIADKILLLARTSPIEECKKNTDGLTLFYTNLDREKIEVREISKMGRAAVDSNQIFIDNLEVPEFDRIGEEGKGFKYILDSLNPERILIAAEALGIGKNALSRAVKYANDRIVFNRPIGKNQSIQHPLAENWIELEAAELLIAKAAYQYDKGENAGGMANAAKYFAAEAGFKAATQAVVTLGGMGYAKEYHVERLLRESLIPKLAPVSAQMILNYISERVLGLPKSY